MGNTHYQYISDATNPLVAFKHIGDRGYLNHSCHHPLDNIALALLYQIEQKATSSYSLMEERYGLGNSSLPFICSIEFSSPMRAQVCVEMIYTSPGLMVTGCDWVWELTNPLWMIVILDQMVSTQLEEVHS